MSKKFTIDIQLLTFRLKKKKKKKKDRSTRKNDRDLGPCMGSNRRNKTTLFFSDMTDFIGLNGSA